MIGGCGLRQWLPSQRRHLLNCSVPAVSMISSITCLPCLFECVSQLRLVQFRESGFSYIHVDRFAICVFDCWIIALNEDSLDELRCVQSLVSMRARKQPRQFQRRSRTIRHTGQSTFSHASRSKDRYVILSTRKEESYKRKPRINRKWGHER